MLVGASAGAPCTSLPITFVDTLGAPPVPLEVTTATSTDVPNTVDGSVIISSLDPPAPSGGITLSAESRVVSPGSGTTIDVLLDSDLPIAAVSFGLAYQDDDVTLLTGSLGSSLSAFRCGAGPEFFSTQFFTSPPGVTFATVFDIQPPFLERELPAGSDLRLLSLEFVTSATPTTTGSDLTFTELGNPPVAIEVTTGTTALTPNTVPGSITFGAGFRRGDCNADGGIDISDAIFMLTFLFQPGGPTPTCDDACDGNDNGSLNIADPIGLLGVLFGQAPTMIPPPNSCGTDPTPDLLECDGAAGC